VLTVTANSATMAFPSKKFTIKMGGLLPQGLSAPEACGNGSWNWGTLATLRVSRDESHSEHDGQMSACFTVEWTSVCMTALEDSFDVTQGYWYAGPEQHEQHFPLRADRNHRGPVPLLPGDFFQNFEKYFGGVAEPYWLHSEGVAVWVPPNVPLFYSWQDGYLRLSARRRPPYQPSADSNLRLTYKVCLGANLKHAHLYALRHLIGMPSASPHDEVLRAPIWSTWAEYKDGVTADDVRELAANLQLHQLPASQLEIDDRWECSYGDAEFDCEKFPNAANLVNELHDQGLKVSLWTHPFVNVSAKSWPEATHSGYLVQEQRSDGHFIVGLTRWWQGNPAGILDVTKESAVKWWFDRLDKLRQEVGIDAFKFDAGEPCWLPSAYSLSQGQPQSWPALYTTEFVQRAITFGGARSEVRTCLRNQRLPALVRMLDKDSSWGQTNGLRSLLPTALQMSLSGYPFVLPDMIGGNGYGDGSQEEKNHISVRPSRELFVRWLQATIFMPAVQFSFVPWEYGIEVTAYTRSLLVLRSSMADLIIESAKEACKSGTPIIKPIWWEGPEDYEALAVGDQFLVGSVNTKQLLIAPVLDQGVTMRDVYLPDGRWKLFGDNKIYEGRQWLRKVSADLWTLPIYERTAPSRVEEDTINMIKPYH